MKKNVLGIYGQLRAIQPVSIHTSWSSQSSLKRPHILGGWGELQSSSHGDDQRIFLTLKFFIPEFFGGSEFWQVFVCEA